MRRNLALVVALGGSITLFGCAGGEGDNTNTLSNTNNTNMATNGGTNANMTVNTNANGGSTASRGGAKLSEADRKFITEAAGGGMAEVELGRLATQRAASADVKSFGQRMVNDHTKANNELKPLASEEGVTTPSSLEGKDKETYDRLSKLSGAQFDQAYIKDMVEDHTKDVAEFERESKEGEDKDIKDFAAKTLPTLQEHLRMAREIEAKGHK